MFNFCLQEVPAAVVPMDGFCILRPLHICSQRDLCHCRAVFNIKKALLCYSGNTDGESSTSKMCEPVSLFSLLFPCQGNSVVSCATEVEEEFPSVYTRSLFFWQLERSNATGCGKEG